METLKNQKEEKINKEETAKRKEKTNLQCFVCVLLLSSISALDRPLPF